MRDLDCTVSKEKDSVGKLVQWRRNVFEDTWDKASSASKLVGTIFKNRTFLRFCPKIWLGHVPICYGALEMHT